MYQRTIAKKVSVTGIGIHSGKKVTLTLHPAEADFGVCFKRTDIANSPIIKASAETVGATENNTTLGDGPGAIHTVEHLLSVFYGLGINNVYCEIDGPEVPIMDGSGASFIFLLKETGIASLKTYLKNFLLYSSQLKLNLRTSGPRLSQLQNWLSIHALFLLILKSKTSERFSSFRVKILLKRLVGPGLLDFLERLTISRERG